MENKTKVKVAVVMGIVILAVVFIFMVIFVKGNRPQKNKNIPTIINGYAQNNENTVTNSSKESNIQTVNSSVEVVSIGIKNDALVKINSDLTSSVISEFGKGYTDFCYGDNKVYTVFNDENEGCSIFEIDLNKNNYPSKLIFNTGELGNIRNLEYYAGKLYFVSQTNQLIEYSISEEYMKAFTNSNEVKCFELDKNSNKMYVSYKPEGVNAGVYLLDFTSNTFSQIITLNDFAESLIFNEKYLIIDVKEFQSLYLYNTVENTVVSIGADNYLKDAKSHIAFYDNILLYTNGSSIDLKDFSGNASKDGWYVLNDKSIAGISMIDSKRMQIERFDESGKITKSIIINLANGETKEVSDSVYTDVIRIN